MDKWFKIKLERMVSRTAHNSTVEAAKAAAKTTLREAGMVGRANYFAIEACGTPDGEWTLVIACINEPGEVFVVANELHQRYPGASAREATAHHMHQCFDRDSKPLAKFWVEAPGTISPEAEAQEKLDAEEGEKAVVDSMRLTGECINRLFKRRMPHDSGIIAGHIKVGRTLEEAGSKPGTVAMELVGRALVWAKVKEDGSLETGGAGSGQQLGYLDLCEGVDLMQGIPPRGGMMMFIHEMMEKMVVRWVVQCLAFKHVDAPHKWWAEPPAEEEVAAATAAAEGEMQPQDA
jgi:hypothetical protein